ncbi:hypothetical protein NEUTE1DRAFT_68844 [Neurospora tetrasperma FGSC 2508]|uniref:Uncharacterized protein n=1 Tax=Neurospora tetrasperma (strain FGSC 2508 / ATCC MYA-4615 / P0657) TaxID=510951 RepID=F8MX39_NEUT8|nr:uncharacterized protein NEUTE1DRAFT_68844 [Neurospora tetrasperma FGSC 2508]EGO54310.1 hypothetical protein NEUTE1DRAFT_68844 [Neurospora tetrasperma FGSC 2508]EGZ68255.1 hypothetical protein NEUTE2DRAFT_96582 [Neurospora tetrasperma FGSC 2509]
MEDPAPKRRRTSPRNSVPVPSDEAPTTQQPNQTTPEDTPAPESSGDTSTKRPSYASPTKASLQRHNPEVLQRRESLSLALRSQSESHDNNPLRSPARRPGIAKSPERPNPRPLPPPAPEDDEVILNPFRGRGLHRSPVPGVLPKVIVPEPDLPPTPEHPDLVVSTPPSGIHNTPSKRPRRSKALAETLRSSSPTKRAPVMSAKTAQLLVPGKPSEKLAPIPTTTEIPAEAQEPTTAELRGLQPPDPDADKKRLRDSLLAEIAELERDLAVASKENERLRQAYVSKLKPSAPPNAIEILDLLRRRALPPKEQKDPDPSIAATSWLSSALHPIAFLPFSKPPSTGDDLPSLFSTVDDEKAEKPPISHHPLPMSADEALPYLQVFTPLTFTSAIFPLPPTESEPEPSLVSSAAAAAAAAAADQQPLLQRHYITATTPSKSFTARLELTVNTSNIFSITDLSVPLIHPPTAAAELAPLIERIIEQSKKGTSSSAMHNNVSVLCWAMGEWVRVAKERARVWCVLETELNAGKEAVRNMVEGWRERSRMRQKRRTRMGVGKGSKKRKAPRRDRDRERDGGDGGGRKRDEEGGSDENEQQEEEMEEEEEEEELDGKKVPEQELVPYMSRTSMDFDIPLLLGSGGGPGGAGDPGSAEKSSLRVQWKIEFDWTGEARSDIRVFVALPGKWHKCDERGQLAKIPALFDDLVQGGEEPLSAVRTVAALLAGEPQPQR